MITRRTCFPMLLAASAPAVPRIDWNALRNPILDRNPVAVRDPAVVLHQGTFYCYCTIVEPVRDTYRLSTGLTTSTDLAHWSQFRMVTPDGPNFSSPGNIFRRGGKWRMCVQSYPINKGASFGNETSRLWLMDSNDLVEWGQPYLIKPEGSTARWARTHRQIDPYIVEHDGRYWCFYKTDGCLGLLVSSDLRSWTEASPDRPVLGPHSTPDGVTVENPCVVRNGGHFVLFFAPCRSGRGIGVAVSDDLLRWRDVHYLDFPRLDRASGGATAAVVLDLRAELGRWLMLFHRERAGHAHSAALEIAWSPDLIRWECPGG